MYSMIIIDDEPKIAEGMAQLFPWQNIGFQVMASFTSAREALEYMKDEPTDVVLSDIQMPDMSGLDLCRALIAQEETHVVLFSSYQHYEYMRSAIQLGAEDYLLKPLTYTALTESFTRLKEKLDRLHPAEAQQSPSYYADLTRQVDEYINTHLQDATLVRCAKRVALSPSYLSRIYKEHAGLSFTDRLTQLRMREACRLLRDPDIRAYDIAYDVGYDNPKNFSRAFKAYMGCTPSEYREGGGREDEA